MGMGWDGWQRLVGVIATFTVPRNSGGEGGGVKILGSMGGVLMATAALTGCGEQHSAIDGQDELEKVTSAMGNESLKPMMREHLTLMRRGQGCPGEVLRGEALRKMVVKKVIVEGGPSNPIKSSISYYNDGRFATGHGDWGAREGRYWFLDDKVCYTKNWCHRLIRSSDGKFMNEILNHLNPDNLSLACVPVELFDLGEGKRA